MKRKTLVAWQYVGQIEFAVFALLAAFGLALGLTGYLDEDGHRVRWYESVGMALLLLACGLPGLAIDILTRRRLRRLPPDDETGRGFEPVLRTDD